jgi:hypothetical protein
MPTLPCCDFSSAGLRGALTSLSDQLGLSRWMTEKSHPVIYRSSHLDTRGKADLGSAPITV